MNEVERESQLSALFDGELDEAQSGLVVRRILKDPALRATWSRYAVLGASLRGEPLSLGALGQRPDVAARVASALALEPELPRTGALKSAPRAGLGGGARAAVGGAIAAGVAAASLLVMRLQGDPQAAPVVQMAAVTPVADAPPAARIAEPARPRQVAEVAPAQPYTTPDASSSNGALPAPLVNYVVAHSEYLTPVMRFNPLSAVVMGGFEPGELVEATEAEIGAVRR
jgi:sigma-E factor negative regulatory protein RseA